MKSELAFVLAMMVVSVIKGSDMLTCRECKPGHACSTIECQSNELCYTGDVIHLLLPARASGCLSAHACRDMTQLLMRYMQSDGSATASFGKRNNKRYIHMCDACCGDDMCNTASCHHIRHQLFSMYQAGTLNMTSLSLIEPTLPPVTATR